MCASKDNGELSGGLARPPWVFLAALLAAIGSHLAFPGPKLLPFPVTLVGVGPIAVAFGLAAAERRAMDRHGQSGMYTDAPTALITTGPFRYSRNPLYLAMLLVALGVALLLGTLLPLLTVVVAFVAMNSWVIAPEERVLLRRFGSSYEGYRKTVRRWL